MVRQRRFTVVNVSNDRKVTYVFIEIKYYALRPLTRLLEVAVLELNVCLTETPHFLHYNAKARKCS